MFFLIAAALFAAIIVSFTSLMAYSRSHPALFAGDILPMAAAVFYTGLFTGSLFLLCAGAIRLAPNVMSGLVLGMATAIAIVFAVGYLQRRSRPAGTISPAH